MALPPSTALRHLGGAGRIIRQLGGNANMHWLAGHDGGVAVLRRYGPWHDLDDVLYELRVLDRVAALAWPVPRTLTSPERLGRHVWCLFSYVPGRPRQPRRSASMREELRARGRLLAELHAGLATLTDLGQRPGWRRREEVLGQRADGPSVEEVIKTRVLPDEAKIMLDYADRARARFADLEAERLPVILNHGDLVGSNVRYLGGRLSGIIDFDFTHLDHRAADFVWTWSALNDDFVYGYEEVTPLEAAERALLTPAFWASVLDSVRMKLLWEVLPERVSLPGPIKALQRRSALTIE
ncbi:MAG: phosphotransferase enzyme family protein [Chloroflexota bacterium]